MLKSSMNRFATIALLACALASPFGSAMAQTSSAPPTSALSSNGSQLKAYTLVGNSLEEKSCNAAAFPASSCTHKTTVLPTKVAAELHGTQLKPYSLASSASIERSSPGAKLLTNLQTAVGLRHSVTTSTSSSSKEM